MAVCPSRYRCPPRPPSIWNSKSLFQRPTSGSVHLPGPTLPQTENFDRCRSCFRVPFIKWSHPFAATAPRDMTRWPPQSLGLTWVLNKHLSPWRISGTELLPKSFMDPSGAGTCSQLADASVSDALHQTSIPGSPQNIVRSRIKDSESNDGPGCALQSTEARSCTKSRDQMGWRRIVRNFTPSWVR